MSNDYEKIISVLKALQEFYDEEGFLEYEFYGLRVENKKRKIGEIITENSKILFDDREFPDFDSDEYQKLEELNGVSAWQIPVDELDRGNNLVEKTIKYLNIKKNKQFGQGDFVYLLGANKQNTHDGADYGEIVLEKPVVIDIIRNKK